MHTTPLCTYFAVSVGEICTYFVVPLGEICTYFAIPLGEICVSSFPSAKRSHKIDPFVKYFKTDPDWELVSKRNPLKSICLIYTNYLPE